MRSLFHFSFPAQPPSQQPSPIATVPLQPEICHRPHPAPMRRQRRSPALLSAARTHWARLVRIATIACRRPHRIYPTACRHPHPPYVVTEQIPRSSPPITTIVRRRRLTRVALRRPHRAHRAPTSASPPISLLALRRPQGPDWQEPHRMHPFFAECAKKALFLATSARNACFSRSEWQHPRPMHPFPGAIGRFGIHGARILPPRALFRVEEPEITHGAKMLPAPPGLSAAAACGPAERALRHAARAWPACRMRPPVISLVSAAACAPCHLARVHRRRLIRVALRRPHRVHRAQPSAASPIAVGMSCRSGSSCRPRAAHADASRYLRAAPIPPAARTHRVQETSGTTQTTQCGHKNRIPKWGPH